MHAPHRQSHCNIWLLEVVMLEQQIIMSQDETTGKPNVENPDSSSGTTRLCTAPDKVTHHS